MYYSTRALSLKYCCRCSRCCCCCCHCCCRCCCCCHCCCCRLWFGLGSHPRARPTNATALLRNAASTRYHSFRRACKIPGIHTCLIPRIVWPQDWNPECSPRFAGLFSTRDGPFHLLLPRPGPPASISPGQGLPGGLLEGSCARRKRSKYAKPAKRGHLCPLITAVSK